MRHSFNKPVPRRAAAAGLAAAGVSGVRRAPAAPPGASWERFRRVGPFGMPRDSVAVDLGRARIQLWMPPGAEAAVPLLFSHTAGGDPTAYHRLLAHLASHGFAAVAPWHDDAGLAANGLWGVGGGLPPGRAGVIGVEMPDPAPWLARASDLSRAADAIPVVERTMRVRLPNAGAFAVGHGAGAMSVSLAMGARALAAGGRAVGARDERVIGGVLLSPQGRGRPGSGLVDGSWDAFAAPALLATGPGDVDVSGETPDRKADGHFLAPPGGRYLMWANPFLHSLVSGPGGPAGSPQEEHAASLRGAIACFLAAHASGDAAARADLDGGLWGRLSGGRAEIRVR